MSNIPPPPPPPGSPPGGTPPPPPPGWGAPQSLEPVGAWMRFLARFLDGLVLAIPAFIIGAVLGGGAYFAGFGSAANDFAGYLGAIIGALLSFGYQVLMESSRGQTIGKMITGIKVIGADGNVPTQAVASRRNLWMLASLLPFLGGVISLVFNIVIGVTIANGAFKRGWHDNYAGGTAVVRAR